MLNDIEKVLVSEEELKEIGVDVCYFPYTEGISSTEITEKVGGHR